MSELFISYSRRDKVFVERFIQALQLNGYSSGDIWVDWEDIPASSKWENEIGRGIEEANSVIFILSPSWVASGECAKELDYAAKFNKRLFPIVCQDVDPRTIRPELASLNWIFFRETDNFDAALQTLFAAVKTDLDWVNRHTHLLRRSNEWNAKGRDDGYLLRGTELQEAESWLSQAGEDKQPRPTALQSEYIYLSRQDDLQRQRRNLVRVTVALVVSVILAISAAVAGIEALRQSQNALASQLAAQATNIVYTQPDLSLLLSLEANYIGDQLGTSDPALLGSLVTSLNSSPHLGTYLREHKGAVRALAFSSDGKWMASAGEDKRVILWDLTQTPIKSHGVLDGASERILAVSFNGDSRYVLGAGDDKKLFVWDIQKCCAPVNQIDVGNRVRALAVVRIDDRELVATGAGTQVSFWDIAAGTEVSSLRLSLPTEDTTVRILSLAVTQDNSLLAVGSDDGNATVWDLSSKEVKFQACSYGEPETNDETVCHRSGEGQTDVRGVAFSPDGKLLISGSSDPYARLWDTSTGKLLARSPESTQGGHTNTISSVAFNLKGDEVTTASWDNTVRVWRLDPSNGWSFTLVDTLYGHSNSVWVITYSRDGKLLASGSSDKTVIVWRPNQVSEIGRTVDRMDGDVWALAVSTNGKQVSAGDAAGSIHLWNFDGRTLSDPKKLKQSGGVWTVAFSRDNKWLVSAGSDGGIHVWNTQTGAEAWSIENAHQDEIWSVMFSPDGRYLASASFDKTVNVWDVNTHKLVTSLPHEESVYALAFSSDGTRLFVAGYGPNIYSWDVSQLASAQSPKLLTGHQAAVNSLAFNPIYPSIMASTSDDKTLLVWNVDNGESTLPVWGLNESMEAVAFHPNGDELASATNNKTVLLWKWDTDCAATWDRNSCQPSIVGSPLIGHDTAVENLIFLSDTRLLSSSEDGQLILWNLDKSFWYQQACTIVNRSLSPAETSQYLEGRIRTRLLKAQAWFSQLFSRQAQQAAPSCLSSEGS